MLGVKRVYENWVDIAGYEGIYQISNLGRIKSLQRKIPNPKNGFKTINERIMKPKKSKGYWIICLCSYGIVKTYKVHRLLAIAFIPNPENKAQVNHIDGDRGNNNLENLEWVTPSENTQHAYDNGFVDKKGENAGGAKLTEKDVLYIRKNINKNGGKFNGVELAKIFGVGKSTIYGVVNYKTWTHIP